MNLRNFLNHERYKVFFTAAAIIGLMTLYSCDMRVKSLSDPERKLTRTELEAELKGIIATRELEMQVLIAKMQSELDLTAAEASAKFKKFDQFDKFKELVFNSSVAFMQNGAVNPMAILFQIGTIFGVGAVVDDIRTRKKLKNGTSAQPAVKSPVTTDTPE